MELNFISEVAAKFAIEGSISQIVPIKTGHIHDSYRVESVRGAYFLQQINHRVFPDVAGIMRNIALVTQTLKTAFENTHYETLNIVPTKLGENFLEYQGNFWRMYEFLESSVTYEVAPNPEVIAASAQAFVAFTQGLQHLTSDRLTITIPKFHSMRYRLEQLKSASANQIKLSREEREIDLIISDYASKMIQLELAWEQGHIPTRITHNDTKLNNVLFDVKGRACCIVDLDTVMLGIIHFDIGDALRTMSSTAKEDEENPDLVKVEERYYFQFLDTYKNEASYYLTAEERKWMPYAAPYMALIMAIRFFTDHLNGNVYFHCQYPTHNLVRARNQLSLTKQFLKIEKIT